MGALTDKVALITGGSTGIGFATAQQFVADGAYVFITARRQKELDQAASTIGKNITGIVGDVSKPADLDRIMATIEKQKKRLDILFANAGVATYQRLGEITEEEFDRHFNINVKGALFSVQKALPLLRDGASIILCSSVVGSKGLGNNSVYSATKAALRSFARTFTTDLKERKIRVNVVSPGAIKTPVWRILLVRRATNWKRCSPTGCHSAGLGAPKRSPKRCRSSLRMPPAISQAPSYSSTADSHRCDAAMRSAGVESVVEQR
jgi:NAD(P)-dependent dehydrogenase (short-subunit alcohol dehydrogenase family)